MIRHTDYGRTMAEEFVMRFLPKYPNFLAAKMPMKTLKFASEIYWPLAENSTTFWQL